MKKLLAIAVVTMAGATAWAQALDLPFVSDLTNADEVAQWTIVNANGDMTYGGSERTWTIANGDLYMDSYSANDDYAFTPALNMPKGKIKLSYEVHGYTGNYCDSYEVLLATSTTVDATAAVGTVLESLESNEIKSGIYGDAREVEFTTPEAGVYYIAFHDNEDDPWALYIRNVQVEVVDAVTGINNIQTGNVVSTRYYNMAGMQSSKPFNGVNIVVTEMSDGTTVTSKVIK